MPQSNHFPVPVQSRGKTLVPYNIVQVQVTDPDSTIRMAYEYDEIEIEGGVTDAARLASVATEHARRKNAKAQLKTIKPDKLRSMPELGAAVELLLQALGIEYGQG